MNTALTQNHIQYAGFWRRLMALFIDISLYLVLSAPFMYLLVGHEYFFWLTGNDAYLREVSEIIFILHNILFFVLIFLFWIIMGTTPGKILMGCRIVDAHTLLPISRKQALIRLAGYFVSALPFYLGFIWAAYDKQKQALHDKLAGTLVLYQSDDYASQSLAELEAEFLDKNGNLL